MWPNFVYYKEGAIRSIFDSSVVGSANKCLILSTIHFWGGGGVGSKRLENICVCQ